MPTNNKDESKLPINEDELKQFKQSLVLEFKRRGGYHSLYSIASASSTPYQNNNVITVDDGKSVVNSILEICDYGDLKFVSDSEPIPSYFSFDKLNEFLNTIRSEKMAGPSTSCRSSCTGLCIGTCSSTCNGCNGCVGTCTGCGSCTTACSSSCSGCGGCSTTCNGCDSDCDGCTGVTSACSSCSSTCSGCSNNCYSGCSGNCSGCTGCTGCSK